MRYDDISADTMPYDDVPIASQTIRCDTMICFSISLAILYDGFMLHESRDAIRCDGLQ